MSLSVESPTREILRDLVAPHEQLAAPPDAGHAEMTFSGDTRAAATRRGEVIGGKYILGEVLGMGGMGVVYLAAQAGLERSVALKMLRPELDLLPSVVRRFHNEALAGARLSHPNVIAVFDAGATADGSPYLVMEHVSGRSLARIAAEERPLSLRRVADLVRQILAALDETHQAGLVHADVKSDNVLVQRRRDDTEIAKLATSDSRDLSTIHRRAQRP